MNIRLISNFVGAKLRDPSTYILAFIVGAIINLYGQILLPWFRGSFNPPSDLLIEFEIRPAITILSIFLGFLFPFCVGLYSAVTMRYNNRRTEAIARLPDCCPDPMFSAGFDSLIVDANASTKDFMERYGIDNAKQILGESLWGQIVSGEPMENNPIVFFEPAQSNYAISYCSTEFDTINIYLVRLPGNLDPTELSTS
jgi:hypothetical protein